MRMIESTKATLYIFAAVCIWGLRVVLQKDVTIQIAPLTYNVAVLVVYAVVCGCYLWRNRNMIVYHCVHIY